MVRAGIRNTVMELDSLKEKVNNMLIEPDKLNILVDWSENKLDLAAAFLDASVLSFY